MICFSCGVLATRVLCRKDFKEACNATRKMSKIKSQICVWKKSVHPYYRKE